MIERMVKQQLEIITRGATEVIPVKELEKKIRRSLESKIPLKVKLGIDPTTPDVHLGHMVVYKKIRQFQDLGHQAHLIIGDYTARIGDPTGKNSQRPALTREQVEKNCESYTEQIFKIVDRNKTEIHYQSSWFDKVSLQDILTAVSNFSVAHMLTHDTFKKRLESCSRLSLHEMLYPVLQAWDSVFIKSDIELGGMDQKFNILCGRDMQKEKNLEPQVALFMPLLMGSDGNKMSKSLNNHIPVLSTPSDMFGRVMSIKDDLIISFFKYTTNYSIEQIENISLRLKKENPRDIKLELAKVIVTIYHSLEDGEKCLNEFLNVFSKKQTPENIPEFKITPGLYSITLLLKESNLISSVSEGKRLIEQGGLRIDGEKIINPDFKVNLLHNKEIIIKAGKRRFLKVISN